MQRGECWRREGSLCSHTLCDRYYSTSATVCVQELFKGGITQEFCPYPLMPGHWRFVPTYILSWHPSIHQWMLQQRVLGCHARCIFPALGTPLAGSSGKCGTGCLSTPRHRRLCCDQTLTVTGTQAALQPPFTQPDGPHPRPHRSRGDGIFFLRLWGCSSKSWALNLCRVWPFHWWIIALPSSCTHSSFNKTAVI